jgi:hypothetical protein
VVRFRGVLVHEFNLLVRYLRLGGHRSRRGTHCSNAHRVHPHTRFGAISNWQKSKGIGW